MILFNYKYFWNYFEDVLLFGRFFFIEDVGEELDFVLDNVFEKNFIKLGFIYKVCYFEEIIYLFENYVFVIGSGSEDFYNIF